MVVVNDNFLELPGDYLFSEIAHRVKKYEEERPEGSRRIVRMGIGDVSQPLCPAAIAALHRAVDDEASSSTFHGYGPEQGYGWLRSAIADNDYRRRGIEIAEDEIFVSDGAKSDLGNFGDILGPECKIAVTDPVYPVYVDTNVMAGRAGKRVEQRFNQITYLPVSAENGFVPQFPRHTPDIIYLCYPNNPTGTVLRREELKQWVDYAREHGSLILFDSAYEAYIVEDEVPHSIYEIEGAKEVAVEFRSFSKTAGFTGVRCGYTVVPHALKGRASTGEEVSLNRLWLRRQTTKFNGASYLSQRAAEAVYTPEGQAQIQSTLSIYRDNARKLIAGLRKLGLEVYGGVNAPYVWAKAPDGMGSWGFFERLLREYQIVVTPGVGFGAAGEGYVRLTAFASPEDTDEAIKRLTEG